jgi:hypothetical protein
MENIPFSSDFEDLPLWERMKRIFHAPSSTFQAVRSDPGFHDWFLPTAVMVIVWVGTNWLTLDIITDPNLPAFREHVADLSSEDRQQVIAWMDMTREHGWISLPLVAGLAYLVMISLVLLAISRWVFRSDVTLRDMLVVKAYASLITAGEFCVKALLILLYNKSQVLLSPGAILSPEMQETLIGRILVGANLFDLWQACVMGIGVSVMIGMPHRRGMAVIAGLWGMIVVFGAVLAGHPDLQR